MVVLDDFFARIVSSIEDRAAFNLPRGKNLGWQPRTRAAQLLFEALTHRSCAGVARVT